MPSSQQTVATSIVFDYEYDTAGKALSGAKVNCVLNYNQATLISPAVSIQPVQQTTTTDSNGYWQFNLVPNVNISPANTTYTIVIQNGPTYDISVGAAGPYQATAAGTIVSTPQPLSPAATNLTGPITVTGNESITGTLSVSGTSTLDGTTTGALTATGGATVSGGDLTVASAGRLILGLAASKIVPGITSLLFRDHADANSNLSVTDAGTVTVRNGLVVTAGTPDLSLGSAASRIVPGATSLSLRNNANSADNLLISDAGVVTARGAVTASNVNTNFHAEVYEAANQVITTSTFTVVAFDTVESDPNGNFTTGASAHYTAPVSGRYLVTGAFGWNGSLNSPLATLSVFKNGAEIRRSYQTGTGGTVQTQGVSAVARVVAGDALDLRIFQASGGNGNGAGGSHLTHAQFTYLGPL